MLACGAAIVDGILLLRIRRVVVVIRPVRIVLRFVLPVGIFLVLLIRVVVRGWVVRGVAVERVIV